MSVKLVILGMLKRGPQYGYELKAQIEQEMGDWTSIAFGSIYFALKKLTEEGAVKQAGQEQHGNRPSRIIYEITAEGEKEFSRLLLKIWSDEDRMYFPLDIGLYFMKEMPPENRNDILSRKIHGIEHALSYLQKHREASLSKEDVPAHADAIFTHSLYHLEAEYKWLKELKNNLELQKY